MFQRVHSAQILLRGDTRYNPRFTRQPEMRADGATRITGVMKPDSPEGAEIVPRLPDIPFRYIIPAHSGAAQYLRINTETYRRLQTGESLWDLDFAPQAAQPAPQPAVSGGAALGVAIFAGLLVLAGVSRN